MAGCHFVGVVCMLLWLQSVVQAVTSSSNSSEQEVGPFPPADDTGVEPAPEVPTVAAPEVSTAPADIVAPAVPAAEGKQLWQHSSARCKCWLPMSYKHEMAMEAEVERRVRQRRAQQQEEARRLGEQVHVLLGILEQVLGIQRSQERMQQAFVDWIQQAAGDRKDDMARQQAAAASNHGSGLTPSAKSLRHKCAACTAALPSWTRREPCEQRPALAKQPRKRGPDGRRHDDSDDDDFGGGFGAADCGVRSGVGSTLAAAEQADKTVALKDFEDGSGPADGLSLRTKWHAPNIIQTNVSSAGQPLLSELFDSQTWRDNVQ
ncbi:unnamed protein product, partial [Symbiodinium sp. KB8]